MGTAFLHGNGGVPLNYRVVGGTSAPSSPSENTIWVNTSTTITSHVFSATQPTGAEGMVWFKIGTTSSVAFNALKKNAINVYPGAYMQYVSGAWVSKTSKIYQVSAWKEMTTYLYNNGDQCTEITGGWQTVAIPVNATYPNYSAAPTVTHGNAMNIKQADHKAGLVHAKNKINLSAHKKLSCVVSGNANDFDGNEGAEAWVQIRSSLSGYMNTNVIASSKIYSKSSGFTANHTIDLSALSTSQVSNCYVCIAVYENAILNVNSIKLD